MSDITIPPCLEGEDHQWRPSYDDLFCDKCKQSLWLDTLADLMNRYGKVIAQAEARTGLIIDDSKVSVTKEKK